MKTEKTIAMARAMLSAGNGGAYARLLSAAIRSASGKRAAAVRQAIAEDCAERLFLNLSTPCPIAA